MSFPCGVVVSVQVSASERNPAPAALAEEIGAHFDQVLVDEYQDTNRLQSSILLALKPDGAGLTVVGDDTQSIYSFRARPCAISSTSRISSRRAPKS